MLELVFDLQPVTEASNGWMLDEYLSFQTNLRLRADLHIMIFLPACSYCTQFGKN